VICLSTRSHRKLFCRSINDVVTGFLVHSDMFGPKAISQRTLGDPRGSHQSQDSSTASVARISLRAIAIVVQPRLVAVPRRQKVRVGSIPIPLLGLVAAYRLWGWDDVDTRWQRIGLLYRFVHISFFRHCSSDLGFEAR